MAETQESERQVETSENGDAQAGHLPPTKPISAGRALLVLAILLIVAVVVVITGIVPRVRAKDTLNQQTQALAAPNVLASEAAQEPPTNDVMLPGNISAYTDSPIYARTNGYLEKWYYDIGAHVKKGALLAIISTPEIDQQLAQAKADLATAQANSKQAQQTSARYEDLLKQDAVSRQDSENFATQSIASNTAVSSAQANVKRLEDLQAFERVYAPFDGVVTARNIDVGQLIDSGGGKELFHLAALDTLRVFVNVPQVYAYSLTPGMTALLTFAEYPGRTFPGKLVRTSRSIDPASRTLLVEVDADNRRGELFPGSYVEVHFKIKPEGPSFSVPVSALIFRADGLRIGTVVDGNRTKLVPVVLGHDDGRVVQVLSGIEPGMKIITNPPDSLIDGETVHVVTPQQSQGQGQ
jgi:RND family efflux transporter MFP subunit